MNFREYKITYDQLLSRVEKIRFGQDYPILDDMVGTTLDEKFLEEPKDAQLYQCYMDILAHNLEKDKRPLT
jgi:hypothetical protein